MSVDKDEDDKYTDLSGDFMETGEDDDDDGVTENEDGSATVSLDDDAPAETSEHFENLAETLPPEEISKISSDLLDAIERDKRAREKRDMQYADGLKKTALSDDAPGGADFEGASRAAHPVLTEACVDFESRAIKELFPPTGPVKDWIPGEVTAKKVEKAKRKSRLMNRQLVKEIREFRSELEQLLTQLPLGGSQYLKLYHSKRLRRISAEFVPIDNILIPFAASSFRTAERKTHIQYLTDLEMKRRVKSGQYVDINSAMGEMVEASETEKINQKIEGKEEDGFNNDGLRTVFEIACYLDFESEDDFWPYLVTIDKSTHKVLAIYRNWDEEDEDHEELTHIVEFPFIPWRGGYGIGLPHMIGGLTTAVNGALRALLDNALANTVGTGVMLGQQGTPGQAVNLTPGTVAVIESGIGQNDVRQKFMPVPFNAPSPVLFQLLGFLVDAAKGVVRTSFEDLADQGQNMPVGTTMALIEQGMTVYSGIFGRLHNAMAEVLDVVHRLNRYHLKETDEVDEAGEVLAKREDFEGPLDVIPVSDPHIFSETQRIAQVQAVSQRAQLNPDLYNRRKVEERLLETLKVPNSEELLVKAPEPQNLNAVNENFAAMLGRPVTAFPDQDHMAHIVVHLDFIKSPMFGMNQFIGQAALPTLLAHLREHVGLWYIKQVLDAATEANDGYDIMDLFDAKDDEVMAEFDRLMATTSPLVVAQAQSVLAEIPQVIQMAQQFLQQNQPQMPQDPKAQVAMAETNRRQAADAQNAQLKGRELELKQQAEQRAQAELGQRAQQEAQRQEAEARDRQEQRTAELMSREQDRQSKDAQKQAELRVKDKTNTDDNNTALQIASMEIQDSQEARRDSAILAAEDRAAGVTQAYAKVAEKSQGANVSLSTGTGINPGS